MLSDLQKLLTVQLGVSTQRGTEKTGQWQRATLDRQEFECRSVPTNSSEQLCAVLSSECFVSLYLALVSKFIRDAYTSILNGSSFWKAVQGVKGTKKPHKPNQTNRKLEEN